MKQHWLETLYRKEEPFGRVLLFSVMRKMTLLLHCHAFAGVRKGLLRMVLM